MAVLIGVGAEKEMTIGCFAWQKWEWASSLKECLNQRIFYFMEQREAIVRCLRSHGKYQHQQQFCIERKERLSVPLNYTVLNK